MRIFRYLFQHKLALALVFVLLIAEAACDLLIPMTMSNIVDVGIQQSGMEHVATSELSSETYDSISDDLSGADKQLFEDSYDKTASGSYALNRQGEANISRLDAVMATPLAKVYGLESGADDSMAQQVGISAALKEYAKLGYDLPKMQMTYLTRTGLLMLGIAAASAAFAILLGLVASITGCKIGRDLRSALFRRVVNFSDAEISNFSASSLITRGTNDIQLIQNISIMLMRMVLYAPIIAIGGIVMVVITSPEMGWIVAIAIVVVMALVATLFKVTNPKFRMMQKLIDKVNLIAREMLTGLPVIRAYNREDYEQMRFDSASEKLKKTQLFTNRAMSFMMPAMILIMNLVSVCIVWFGGLAINEGTLQTGDLIAFITYAMVIIMGFLMLGMVAVMLPRANVAAGRVNEVIGCTPSVVDPVHPVSPAAYGRGVGIEFDGVSFRYSHDGECALHDITFSVEPGQTLAIVGGTGSGKSTILKLIERFYDASEGCVRVDGIDVRDMTQATLRSMLAYVPQKAFLFTGTVKSNIAYSGNVSDDEVARALRISQSEVFVDEMPEGDMSPISEGGTNVSGGQRQRLAIARALAANAPALLLDDSFSALDFKTDAALRAALASDEKGRTIVVVAQRISTVMNADKILALDNGCAVGLGTHEELMETCEEYREIALSQLSRAELGGGEAA